MSITFTPSTDPPYEPDGIYAKQTVLATTSGGTATGSFTSILSRVIDVDCPGSFSIASGNVVTVANLPAGAGVYKIECKGYI